MVIMTPGHEAPHVRETIDTWARTSARWRVITFEEVLERLVCAGVAALEAGQSQTLVQMLIREQSSSPTDRR
ncbi:hypothetical protein [Arthrobacter sp. ERGS1:01]|uniref:hypothetical protein n=1 Tax=Arthrobacter sp. ERGS1:01 TaxID=1704044 RepID=UPI001ED9C137|nr:hypothetical protein [Arthrobacter sp. ERGS1:01]